MQGNGGRFPKRVPDPSSYPEKRFSYRAGMQLPSAFDILLKVIVAVITWVVAISFVIHKVPPMLVVRVFTIRFSAYTNNRASIIIQ